MADPSNIVTPIALDVRPAATLSPPWFLDIHKDGHSEFHPLPASYKPLVNGKETFGALYDAILAAKRTIDIVCWGFQPSMYFKRDGGSSLRIGDLLIQKGLQGVKIRILCWGDTLPVSQIVENSMPGYSVVRSLFTQNEISTELEYDRQWYDRARGAASPESQTLTEDLNAHPQRPSRADSSDGQPKQYLGLQPLVNIEVVRRDFSLADRAAIISRMLQFRTDKDLSDAAIVVGFGGAPTHHQKMVMIDYEVPEQAVGFVMGHNMLDAYWDDDAHGYAHMHPRLGRNGETPRQDMSAMVTGPILEHLNVNFCRAWKRDANVDLLSERKPLAARLKIRREMGTAVMAQINRTQSQERIFNIGSLYMQAASNVCQFIYLENQYFRWAPLAEKINEIAKTHVEWGRDPGKHGPIHVFVVTNSTDEGVGPGTVNTYRMMESLGHAWQIPGVARLERGDVLDSKQKVARRRLLRAENTEERENARQELSAIDQQIKDNEADEDNKNDEDNKDKTKKLPPPDFPGLKIHICTLVAPDTPAGKDWMPVYVHSKIMIVDDVFLTHGSANLNSRSMEVDSELNLCHEHSGVTAPLRRRLWNIHTGGKGAQDNPAEAFVTWGDIMDKNGKRVGNKEVPYASLVRFMREDPTRTWWD